MSPRHDHQRRTKKTAAVWTIDSQSRPMTADESKRRHVIFSSFFFTNIIIYNLRASTVHNTPPPPPPLEIQAHVGPRQPAWTNDGQCRLTKANVGQQAQVRYFSFIVRSCGKYSYYLSPFRSTDILLRSMLVFLICV